MLVRCCLVLALLSALLPCPAQAAPDEEALGKARGYPVGNWENWFFDEGIRVGTFSQFDRVRPYNVLRRADLPSDLPQTRLAAELSYRYKGKRQTLDDYLAHQRVAGLMIVHDGRVLVERYQYGRGPQHRFISNSIAKSLVSLAVGFALQEKRFVSLDDRLAAYVPELKNHPYGETRLRSLLRMASGLRFAEDYKPGDDLFRFQERLLAVGGIEALRGFGEREAREGSRFHYASIETQALALALRAVTGQTLAEYLAPRLWQPLGAESDAYWTRGADGMELAYGYFNATLRDYARLGAMLANDGVANGRQIVPRDYLLEATDWQRHPPSFAPGRAGKGYGYQFWTMPGASRRFALFGVYGQAIFVDPEAKLVLVHMAVARQPSVSRDGMGEELAALWAALSHRFAPDQRQIGLDGGDREEGERTVELQWPLSLDELWSL